MSYKKKLDKNFKNKKRFKPVFYYLDQTNTLNY